MYVENIKICNYGPLKSLDISLEFDDMNNPKPLVIVGENGSGKSLLLSNIVDSLIEFKRSQYTSLLEVQQDNYFKLGKKDYISYGSDYSYVNLKFKTQSNVINYTDLVTNLNYTDFVTKYSTNIFDDFDINHSSFKINGFYKHCYDGSETLEELNKHIYLYFPYDRYETPAWLNNNVNARFKRNDKLVGYSNKNIIKTNILQEIESWVLDLALDRELYEKVLVQVDNYQVFRGYNGKNSNIILMINQMLTQIYKIKFGNIKSSRIGIDPKGNRRVSIFITKEDGVEINIAPTFSHLSTGEIMLLSLFTSILKEYDEINNRSIEKFSDVSGIVIIDEIDLHLHIAFQKDIILNLIKMFPKIQFIITTHSPFLVIGLKQILVNNYQLISLPLGNAVQIEEFNEFQNAYDIFIEANNRYKNLFYTMDEIIKQSQKPLIITEGKTDWKHMKKALDKLKSMSKFRELDVEFLEYEDEIKMGDSDLKALCEQFAKVSQNRKIICVFDRDTPKIVKDMAGEEMLGYRNWGNSVYSFCIPIPSHRTIYSNISIEFYYTDEEIHTLDNNKQLLFSNEVEERATKSCTTGKFESKFIKLEIPKPEEEVIKKIYCLDVDKILDEEGNQVALSKAIFSENVYNEKDGFKDFKYDEFEKIFQIIYNIVII